MVVGQQWNLSAGRPTGQGCTLQRVALINWANDAGVSNVSAVATAAAAAAAAPNITQEK